MHMSAEYVGDRLNQPVELVNRIQDFTYLLNVRGPM